MALPVTGYWDFNMALAKTCENYIKFLEKA